VAGQKQITGLEADLAALSARLDFLESLGLVFAATTAANSASFSGGTTQLLPLVNVTPVPNAVPGVTLVGNQVLGLPAGEYRIRAGTKFENIAGTRGFADARIQVDGTTFGTVGSAYVRSSGNDDGATCHSRAVVTLTGTEALQVQMIETPGSTGNATFQSVTDRGYIEVFRIG